MNVSLYPGLNEQREGGGFALLRVWKVDLRSGAQKTLKLSAMRSLKPQIFTAVTAKTTGFPNLTPYILAHANDIFVLSWNLCVQYKVVNTIPILYTASLVSKSWAYSFLQYTKRSKTSKPQCHEGVLRSGGIVPRILNLAMDGTELVSSHSFLFTSASHCSGPRVGAQCRSRCLELRK